MSSGPAKSLATAVVVSMLLAGCQVNEDRPSASGPDETPSAAEAIPSEGLALPTREPEGAEADQLDGVNGGVVVGRVAAEGVCVWISDSGDAADESRFVSLRWPHGYYALADPVRVFDADGVEVARDGDLIFVGGGYGPAEEAEHCAVGSAVWDVWEVEHTEALDAQ